MNARPAAAALLPGAAGLWAPPIGSFSSGSQTATLEQLLKAGAQYVDKYQQAFSATGRFWINPESGAVLRSNSP